MIDVKLIIPDEVFQKVMWWVNKSNHEVSGFGSLDFDPDSGVFKVRDAILLKQEVAPTSTEIDPVAIGKAMYEMREEKNALKWHWHSHVNMGVFWSGDDRTLIKNLGSQGWIVASVFNKKCEIKSAFYTLAEIGVMGITKKQEVFLEDIHTKVERFIPKKIYEKWDKEYDTHVTVEKPRAITGTRWNGPMKKGFIKGIARRTEVIDLRLSGVQTASEHDNQGFRYSYMYNRWLYNPIYDKRLKDETSVIVEILTMDDEEVDSAYSYYGDKDNRFKALYEELLPKEPVGNLTAANEEQQKVLELFCEH